MALLNQYAVTTVISTQVRSADEKSILVEAGGFTPTRWFLEHAADEAHGEDHGPPKKRRKVQHSTAKQVTPPPLSVEASDNEIVIQRITLDFQFPDTVHAKEASESAVAANVDFEGVEGVMVIPLGIQEDRLRFVALGKVKSVLFVDHVPIPQSACEGLRQIASRIQVKGSRAGPRSQSDAATNVRCMLKRSVGQLYNVVRLEATISWVSGVSASPSSILTRKRINEDYEYLTQAFPDHARTETGRVQPWTPMEFYDSVHIPSKELSMDGKYEGILENELYPFQKRAVAWMLNREGVVIENGQIKEIGSEDRQKDRPNFYTLAHDADGEQCFVNHLQGIIARNEPFEHEETSGGVLAEEMGLGKTVEVLALLSLHTRPKTDTGKVEDAVFDLGATRSKATLIITPPAILTQWRSELEKHAPSLSVHVYDGIPGRTVSRQDEKTQFRSLCSEYDVVLTTYSTLAREVHFAEDPPDRNMRHARRFERKRSPLVRIHWWRICLDEAQMVESGVTAAARVACRLPRVHSWAVSGTPLRKDFRDLHGLLIFLKYKPFCDDSRLWAHLVRNHRHLFRKIFAKIALRHSKGYVRDELRLPPQKRVVLTVPFSAIEQQHYATMFAEMCEEVGVGNDGSPANDEWDPSDPDTAEAMRTWLSRLRQTCLHPQVGGRNRKALGRGQGPLRTVAEVLEIMIEQNETSVRIEERAVLAAQLAQAHILGNNGEDKRRSEKALEIYKRAMNVSAGLVQEARERLEAGKAEARSNAAKLAETVDEDSDTEANAFVGRLRTHLRTVLQLQHACTFFAATANFQIKSNEDLTEPESKEYTQLDEQEASLYETAKSLRKEILIDTSKKADDLMHSIKALETQGDLTEMPHIEGLHMTGIESRRIVEKSRDLFALIRAQSKVICGWRAKMAEYLLKPLVDEDEEGLETTGEEYETSTKQQDELYVYFDAVKAMQADLNTFITGEDAPLIDHEVRFATAEARKALDPEHEFTGNVHAPELLLELLEMRNKFRRRKEELGSVRGLIQEARHLESSMQLSNRGEVERELVRDQVLALQKVFTDYTKALGGLEKELDLFRSTQNQRIEFYKQLQELSDAVAPYKEEIDEHLDEAGYDRATTKEQSIATKLAQLKTKQRFLLHLREENGSKDGPRMCVICQNQFESGVLTVCGHQYCKECIQHWWHQHRSCPVCKRKLVSADFHDITYKPRELKAQEETHSSLASPGSFQTLTSDAEPAAQQSIYSDVDTGLMSEIKSIDLPSSYGTKIDTLGRHLHWIREHDPGAKSIVFSQYREFLDVLGTALQDFKIGYSRLGRRGAVEKFKHNASIDCLLLDARTDSSGLTLVNATHVFICEPLIQTAVELQAIARVHRIGQTRPTTVWMYLVNGTVEESIYELSVARRLAHVQSRQPGKSRATSPGALQENAIDAANSEELQSAPISKLLASGKGGGELVERDDLWQCLFGKLQETNGAAQPSVELEREHVRAEAADERRVT